MIEIRNSKVHNVIYPDLIEVVENGKVIFTVAAGEDARKHMRNFVDAYNKVEGFEKKLNECQMKISTETGYFTGHLIADLKEYFSPKPQPTVGGLKTGISFTFVNSTKATPNKYRTIDQTLLPKLDDGMCWVLYEDKWRIVSAAQSAPCKIVEKPKSINIPIVGTAGKGGKVTWDKKELPEQKWKKVERFFNDNILNGPYDAELARQLNALVGELATQE